MGENSNSILTLTPNSNSEADGTGVTMFKIMAGPVRLVQRSDFADPEALLLLLSDVEEQLFVHYLPAERRSVPCLPGKCQFCESCAPIDDLRYLPVLIRRTPSKSSDQFELRRAVWQIYPSTWEILRDCELPGLMVGAKTGAGNQLIFKPCEWRCEADSLPEPHSIRPTMLRVWKIRQWPVEGTGDSNVLKLRRAMGE